VGAAVSAYAQAKKSLRLSRPYETIFASPPIPGVAKHGVIARGPERERKPLGERVPVGWCGRHGIAGAPSAIYDGNSGVYWLTDRAAADGPRICESHIARSRDGKRFTDVKLRNIANEPSCPLKDPRTGKFKLYFRTNQTFGLEARKLDAPAPAGGDGGGADGWRAICKLDDVDSPEEFDLDTARIVLQPSPSGADWNYVKDPCVVSAGNRFYMYYIGRGRYEQCCLATPLDGEKWEKHPANPALAHGGWHNFYTRPGDVRFLVVLVGSPSSLMLL